MFMIFITRVIIMEDLVICKCILNFFIIFISKVSIVYCESTAQ